MGYPPKILRSSSTRSLSTGERVAAEAARGNETHGHSGRRMHGHEHARAHANAVRDAVRGVVAPRGGPCLGATRARGWAGGRWRGAPRRRLSRSPPSPTSANVATHDGWVALDCNLRRDP